MTNQANENHDSDLPYVLIACGVFTLTLLLVDSFYGNMNALFHSWVKVPFIILHILLIALWIIVIKNIDDPNKDIYRKLLLAVNIAALLLILAHRAGYISDKMFKQDIEKNKQEQIQ